MSMIKREIEERAMELCRHHDFLTFEEAMIIVTHPGISWLEARMIIKYGEKEISK